MSERIIIESCIKSIKDKIVELESQYEFAREKRTAVIGMKELNYTEYTRSMYKKAKSDIDLIIKGIQSDIMMYESKIDELEDKLAVI